jgi:RNA polymerase sigma-70 factor, ECF subfamily
MVGFSFQQARVDARPDFSEGSMAQEQGPSVAASDVELLQAVAQQDRGAFRELYDRYASRLMAYVRVMGGPRMPAEDVVQEIFVALWRKAGQYRPALGSPEGWIFTITRHKVVDIWRKQSAVEEVGDFDLDALMQTETSTDQTLVATMSKALERLSPEHREPLVLAYFGGLTYEETAERLHLPVGTLKSRIRVALGQLKSHLGNR